MNKKGITKKRINFSCDIELFDAVSPYINNMSAFIETCLKNFYNKNRDVILNDDLKTAKLHLKDIESKDLPNITYIMNNQPVQLRLFEIVNDRVITGKKEKVFTFPSSKDFSFTSNNTIQLNKRNYYFEIVGKRVEELEKTHSITTPYTEEDKWW